jgi:hypothetical protein
MEISIRVGHGVYNSFFLVGGSCFPSNEGYQHFVADHERMPFSIPYTVLEMMSF